MDTNKVNSDTKWSARLKELAQSNISNLSMIEAINDLIKQGDKIGLRWAYMANLLDTNINITNNYRD